MGRNFTLAYVSLIRTLLIDSVHSGEEADPAVIEEHFMYVSTCRVNCRFVLVQGQGCSFSHLHENHTHLTLFRY